MSLFVFFCCLIILSRSGSITSVGEERAICLLLFTRNYVDSFRRGFLFLWVLGMGYVNLLWHSLSLPYTHLVSDSFTFLISMASKCPKRLKISNLLVV